MRVALHRPVLTALLLGSTSLAGAASWTGYVFNGETRVPLAGALVHASSGLVATTDAQGKYLIQDQPTSAERASNAGWDRTGQILTVELDHRQTLRLEVLDLSGRVLSRPFDGESGPGTWNWSIQSLGRRVNPVVLRLVHKGTANTWTVLPGLGAKPGPAEAAFSPRVAATTTDTFRVSLAGYDSALVLADAASATVDTAWLAPRTVLGEIPWNASITYGTLKDARDNRTYRTVRIGAQNWMAQNLNYKPVGADSGICYNNKLDSCTKYGRLYDWQTAMAGTFASRYLPRAAAGICPAGWHLPTQGEWDELARIAGPDPKGIRDLKSVSGWAHLANGADAYGFRALPAGMNFLGSGEAIGQETSWWTSSAGAQESSIIGRRISGMFITFSSTQPYIGFSLRCVEGAVGVPKDTILSSLIVYGGRGRSLAPVFDPRITTYHDTVPWTFGSVTVAAKALDTISAATWIQGVKTNSANVPLGPNGSTTMIRFVVHSQDGDSLAYQVAVFRPLEPSSFGIPWKTGITYGTLVDTRDGHVYRTVGVGSNTWMAQNLDYRLPGTDSGSCVSNSIDSCTKYGRQYTWANALGTSASSKTVPSGVQGICPSGWHLPSDGEWSSLETIQNFTIEGYKLKSTAGWTASAGNGTDHYGFRALPAGWGGLSGSSLQGSAAYWWTSTEASTPDALYAIGRWIKDGVDPVNSSAILRTLPLSVRCVKN